MNPSLFKSTVSPGSPRYVAPADTTNNAGGAAYKRTAKDTLAQFAVTGCLGDTFYVAAETQLAELLALAADSSITSEFIAKTAIYARRANMKDMPALLCAVLVVRASVGGDKTKTGSKGDKGKEENKDSVLFRAVAPKVLDNLKMIANFVKMLRSGVVQAAIVGGKSTSLPRPARKYVEHWLVNRDPNKLLNDATGIDPGLGDIIKMVHPKPKTPAQAAVFAYFMGKTTASQILAATGDDPSGRGLGLPKSIRDFETFKTADKATRAALIGSINFRRLDALGLTDAEWTELARSASWQTARMNLATYARHNVFKVAGVAELLAAKLRDPEQIKSSRALPYQLYIAHKTTGDNPDVPMVLKNALQDAFEASVSNAPKFGGSTLVAVDISGSMGDPVTGTQGRKVATKVSCREVAGLFAASILRANPDNTQVMAFHTEATSVSLNPRDSVFTNTKRLYELPSGGTACSAPVLLAIKNRVKVDTIVILSDNESWADSLSQGNSRYNASFYRSGVSGLAAAWAKYRAEINPKARLICIDLAPNTTVQVTNAEKTGVYHVGGFSDAVFEYIAALTAPGSSTSDWVSLIEKTEIPEVSLTKPAAPKFKAGDAVTFEAGGEGTVFSVNEESASALVEFASGERLNYQLAKLRKL